MLRVDHAGEHGAVCTYAMQRRIVRWRAPELITEIDGFIAHEQRHRALFGAEIARRGQARCWSYRLCGSLGTVLGLVTGLLGRRAIAATTVAIERVVLRHMHAQIATLATIDAAAVTLLGDIVRDEQQHHDESLERLRGGPVEALVLWSVSTATEAVIWIGMRRPARLTPSPA